ncbi:hypothetical protein GW891_02100, partial [bacterium]|nr:hypothetical protein [bacterium]
MEGIRAHNSISNIKFNYDIVNFVVQPEITLQILEKNIDILKS